MCQRCGKLGHTRETYDLPSLNTTATQMGQDEEVGKSVNKKEKSTQAEGDWELV